MCSSIYIPARSCVIWVIISSCTDRSFFSFFMGSTSIGYAVRAAVAASLYCVCVCRQHTAAYVSLPSCTRPVCVCRHHTSAYVSLTSCTRPRHTRPPAKKRYG